MACSMSTKKTLYLVVLVSFLSVSVLADDPKVNVTLFYESLCPYSGNFIRTGLAQAMGDPDIRRVINLRLVPWGNAVLNESTANIICQHGERECYFNTIHACAIRSWPDQKKHFDFIRCVETMAFEYDTSGSKDQDLWRRCCRQLKLDPSPTANCYSSGFGTELELQYGEETDKLSPPHMYVPWLLVNDWPTKEDYPNFMTYICHYYQGPTPPEACSNITVHSTQDSGGLTGLV